MLSTNCSQQKRPSTRPLGYKGPSSQESKHFARLGFDFSNIFPRMEVVFRTDANFRSAIYALMIQ